MRIIQEIGNGPTRVECHVDLENEEVLAVLYMRVNIVDCLELATLNKITEAAQKKFAEEMSEP